MPVRPFVYARIKCKTPRLHFESRNFFASDFILHSKEREKPRRSNFPPGRSNFSLKHRAKVESFRDRDEDKFDQLLPQTRLLARIGYPAKTPNEMFVIEELLANRGYAVVEVRLEFT